MAKPEHIRIPYEDYESGRFNAIGRLQDGTQFMAFVTAAAAWSDRSKKWLAVVHRFNAEGDHIGSESRLGGFDREGQQTATDRAFGNLEDMLVDLCSGERPVLCDIRVKLFSVEMDGVTHGLLYEQDADGSEKDVERGEWVMLEPHDIMFHPPWDGGEYST